MEKLLDFGCGVVTALTDPMWAIFRRLQVIAERLIVLNELDLAVVIDVGPVERSAIVANGKEFLFLVHVADSVDVVLSAARSFNAE